MDFLAFDIETYRAFPDGAKNLKEAASARPFGIACASTMLVSVDLMSGSAAKFGNPKLWYEGERESDIMADGPMTNYSCKELLSFLYDAARAGVRVVSWNGASFDFDVIAEETSLQYIVANLAMRHIDLMVLFASHTGHRLGLEAAHKGIGGRGKLPGIKGSIAPALWRDDNDTVMKEGYLDLGALDKLQKRKLVLEYVAQDVRMTAEIAVNTAMTKTIPWVSSNGKKNILALSDDLVRSVHECYRIKPTPPFWLKTPIYWPEIVGWLSDPKYAQDYAIQAQEKP